MAAVSESVENLIHKNVYDLLQTFSEEEKENERLIQQQIRRHAPFIRPEYIDLDSTRMVEASI